jgi:hypothetical protein
MMQVVIRPQSLLETGIKVEKVNTLRLFKFTDEASEAMERYNDLLEPHRNHSLGICK